MELLFEQIRQKSKDVWNHASVKRYDVYILEFHKYKGCQREVIKEYKKLRFDQLQKYEWFFRRRAALLQIANPQKLYAFKVLQSVNIEDVKKFKIKSLKDKIRSAKGKLTQYNRKLQIAKDEWSGLFPIEEDKKYQNTVEYLRKKEFSLNSMVAELKELE